MNENFLLVLLVAIVLWPTVDGVNPIFTTDLLAAEGMVALTTNLPKSTKTPTPLACTCGGKGYTKTGDGLHNIPCPTNCSCGCKKTGDSFQETGFINPRLDKQVVMLTAGWCTPCTLWKTTEQPVLQRLGWIVSEDKAGHILLVDVDKNPEIYKDLNIDVNSVVLPSFYLVNKGKVVKMLGGYQPAANITDLYLK